MRSRPFSPGSLSERITVVGYMETTGEGWSGQEFNQLRLASDLLPTGLVLKLKGYTKKNAVAEVLEHVYLKCSVSSRRER